MTFMNNMKICAIKKCSSYQVEAVGVYLAFTTNSKIRKTAVHIDPQTDYVHMYTLENSWQNDCNSGLFSLSAGF